MVSAIAHVTEKVVTRRPPPDPMMLYPRFLLTRLFFGLIFFFIIFSFFTSSHDSVIFHINSIFFLNRCYIAYALNC